MKPKKRKRKLKKGRFLLLILFLLAISFLCYKFVNIPIRNIIVKGNYILTDEEVIKISSLEDYPSIFTVFSFDIKKKKHNLKIDIIYPLYLRLIFLINRRYSCGKSLQQF